MPVYTYRCESCEVQFEQTQKFTDATLVKCPECGKMSLRKVYTPVGIVFKGSGFYATDHRSPSGTAARNQAKIDEGKSEPKSDTPAEPKKVVETPKDSTPAVTKETS